MKKIILKYLNDSLTKKDQEKLLNWLKDSKNLIVFKSIVRDNFDIDLVYTRLNKEKALEVIKSSRISKQSIVKLYWKYAAAAILIGGLMIGYVSQFTSLYKEETNGLPLVVNNEITHGTNKAILTLEDGNDMVIQNGESIKLKNLTSNGSELFYNSSSTHNGEKLNVFNTLRIPRGGEFFVQLSDGTKVWLNSESMLKYPVNFRDGESRIVELVYGEAYFDVSHSTHHKGSDFKIKSRGQEVTVLGTEFNINAYLDQTNIYTTLVEGKINVLAGRENQILTPGQLLNYDESTGSSIVVKNVDVFDQVAWKDGAFSFKRKSIEDIMSVLSRWYDFEVEFHEESTANKGFNGVLGRNQDIIEILETLKRSKAIKNYQINESKIILK